jgi:selenocysteine lyase/cysteine desulfurase
LRPGDHAITTVVDHSSVIRPLLHLQKQGIIELTIVDCDDQGHVAAVDIATAIRDTTRLVAVTHASNVTGSILPVAQIGEICKKRGVIFLIDAAQTIGHIPVDVQTMNCQILAAPGHKGLLGPMGTGLLYLSPAIVDEVSPLRFGGTGSQSVDATQPTEMPLRFEAGSLNVPAIAGLGEGVKFVHSEVGQTMQEHTEELMQELRDGLVGINGVKIYGPADKSQRTGVTSIAIEGMDSHTVASVLDINFEIQIRSGLHCAPLLHKRLGTAELGLVRFSPGPFNTSVDMEFAVGAIVEIAGSV